MRTEATPYMLRENPQYRHIFKRCPNCNHLSLKPVGLNQIDKVTEVLDTNERHCTICSYIHVSHLEVLTRPSTAAEKAGRILEKK